MGERPYAGGAAFRYAQYAALMGKLGPCYGPTAHTQGRRGFSLRAMRESSIMYEYDIHSVRDASTFHGADIPYLCGVII